MKTRAVLLSSLIVLQILCLVWMHYCASAELAAAPHIVVDAEQSRGRAIVPRQGIDQRNMTHSRVSYRLDPYSFAAYKKACRKFDASRLHLTLEIAMREHRSHMATNLFVNGVPISEAVPIMNRGELPQATK